MAARASTASSLAPSMISPSCAAFSRTNTSMGVGFYPPTKLESLVLGVDRTLSDDQFRAANPWIGSDVKIMGFRHGEFFRLTVCVPQLGAHYLTAIGSSIKNGDEGLVGRGNRIQGLISPTRLMSIEGTAGKNPITTSARSTTSRRSASARRSTHNSACRAR